MIRSMTGYGRSEGIHENRNILVELRSVNHRYCEISVKTPRSLLRLESRLKKIVQNRFSRGKIELYISMNGSEDQVRRLTLDKALVKQYFLILEDLKRELHLEGKIGLDILTNFKDIITVTEVEEETKGIEKEVERLLVRAMHSLESMRIEEGQSIAKDLLERIKKICKVIDRIEKKSPLVVKEYRKRLLERVSEFTQGIEIDNNRLLQEVAIYADRSDISEEVVRLKSHLNQMDKMIEGDKAVGRGLDFLVQEINREINTIGSKANDSTISLYVVSVKSEIEKLREQVQNIE